MAALAVKASSALMKSGVGEKCGCRRKKSLLFGEEIANRRVASEGGSGGDVSRRGRSGGDGGRGRFREILSAIPE